MTWAATTKKISMRFARVLFDDVRTDSGVDSVPGAGHNTWIISIAVDKTFSDKSGRTHSDQ